MRPRKGLLLVVQDEALLSRWAFVLETKQFRVYRTQNAAEALALLAQLETDSVYVLIAAMPLPNLDELLLHATSMHPELRTLVTSDRTGDYRSGIAHVFVPSGCITALVDRLKTLTARKRGPKPARIAGADARREVVA